MSTTGRLQDALFNLYDYESNPYTGETVDGPVKQAGIDRATWSKLIDDIVTVSMRVLACPYVHIGDRIEIGPHSIWTTHADGKGRFEYLHGHEPRSVPPPIDCRDEMRLCPRRDYANDARCSQPAGHKRACKLVGFTEIRVEHADVVRGNGVAMCVNCGKAVK